MWLGSKQSDGATGCGKDARRKSPKPTFRLAWKSANSAGFHFPQPGDCCDQLKPDKSRATKTGRFNLAAARAPPRRWPRATGADERPPRPAPATPQPQRRRGGRPGRARHQPQRRLEARGDADPPGAARRGAPRHRATPPRAHAEPETSERREADRGAPRGPTAPATGARRHGPHAAPRGAPPAARSRDRHPPASSATTRIKHADKRQPRKGAAARPPTGRARPPDRRRPGAQPRNADPPPPPATAAREPPTTGPTTRRSARVEGRADRRPPVSDRGVGTRGARLSWHHMPQSCSECESN